MRITNEYNDLYKHWFKTIFPYFLWRYIPINIAYISMWTENNNYLSRVQHLYCSFLLVLSTFVMSSSCIISGLSFASVYCCCISVVLYRKCSLFPLLCVSLFGLYFVITYCCSFVLLYLGLLFSVLVYFCNVVFVLYMCIIYVYSCVSIYFVVSSSPL